MDIDTDIMDLTHQKTRKRPRPISSADESVHASLKRLPMFAVRGEPVPAASLKQNDHSVTSSPTTTVMPAQVNATQSAGCAVPGLWGGWVGQEGEKLCLLWLRCRSGVTGFYWMRCVNGLSLNVECALLSTCPSPFAVCFNQFPGMSVKVPSHPGHCSL